MDVSIIIPAYNEAERIVPTLETVTGYFSGAGLSWEIVVVDDGSTDSTADLVSAYAGAVQERSGWIELARGPHQGKGAAVARGVERARGDWILMTDADLSTPIEEWGKTREALLRGVQLVVGSRQAPGARVEVHQPWARQRLGLLFGLLTRAVFGLRVHDSQCGFKAFSREAAGALFTDLVSTGFCFDLELLLRARERGMKVEEIPVRWINHPDSRVRVLHDWPRVLRELVTLFRVYGRSAERTGRQ